MYYTYDSLPNPSTNELNPRGIHFSWNQSPFIIVLKHHFTPVWNGKNLVKEIIES